MTSSHSIITVLKEGSMERMREARSSMKRARRRPSHIAVRDMQNKRTNDVGHNQTLTQ